MSLATASSPGQERATLRGHAEIVRSLAVFDNGKALATRASDGTIKVWDVGLGRVRLTFGSEESRVLCMGISPDGRWLAAGVRVSSSSATAPPPAAPERPAARARGQGRRPCFQRPKALGRVPFPGRLHRPDPRPRRREAQGTTRGTRPQPAQAAAPAAPPTVEAKVWSLDDGHERAALSGHNGAVVALEFSRDGKTLATTSRAGVVKLWDTRTFQVTVVPAGRQGGVDLVQFSSDGKTLVGANAAGLVTLWDVKTGKARANFQHPGGMNMVVLSPDGKTLATGGSRVGSRAETKSGSGEVRIWEIATGRRLAVLPVPDGRVTRLAFAPDGRTLAAATEAATVMLWDVAARSPLATLTSLSGPALYLAFSPDGKTLAAGEPACKLRRRRRTVSRG